MVAAINKFLRKIDSYYSRWKVQSNPSKSSFVVVYGWKHRMAYADMVALKNIAIRLGIQRISENDSLKYLGVEIDKNFTFTRHIDTITKKTNATIAVLRNILRKGLLTKDVKRTIYKTAIRAIMTYGYIIWAGLSSHQMERLRLIERKFLRLVIERHRRLDSGRHYSNKSLYEEAEVEPIDVTLATTLIHLLEGAYGHENRLLAAEFAENASGFPPCQKMHSTRYSTPHANCFFFVNFYTFFLYFFSNLKLNYNLNPRNIK